VSSLSVTRQRLVQHTAVRIAKRNAVVDAVCARNERGGGDSGFRFFRIEIKHAEARNGTLRREVWQRICLRAVGSCDCVFERVYSGRHGKEGMMSGIHWKKMYFLVNRIEKSVKRRNICLVRLCTHLRAVVNGTPDTPNILPYHTTPSSVVLPRHFRYCHISQSLQ
jgi:hypothetical protein